MERSSKEAGLVPKDSKNTKPTVQSNPKQERQMSSKQSRTPSFQALHDGQYRRQELIRGVEAETGRCLICYVGGIRTSIGRDDVVLLVDLLHNVEPNKKLDFLLHTGGGDMDAADKIISMIRDRVGTEELRIVVPDFAKSAGTLISLGADFLVMSDSSELGPIDPQIVMNDGQGNKMLTPIQSYLDAFIEHSEVLKKNPNDPVAKIMLERFDPSRLKVFEAARTRAREIAENQLKNGMFRSPKGGNWTWAASELLSTTTYPSHSQMIGVVEAKRLGLHVEYLAPHDPLWQMYWQLYSYQRFEIKDNQKLFESNYVSLTIDS